MKSDPKANNNQISKLNYAQGPKTESIKKNPFVLMVAEKPKIAKSITEALSDDEYKKFRGHYLPVYEFNAKFKDYSDQAILRVTSVAGHVYDRDFPKSY